MRSRIITALFAFTLVMPVGIPTASAFLDDMQKDLGLSDEEGPTVDEQRAEVRKMAKDTLAELYKLDPGAKRGIEKAAGYAVFSNFGMKLGFVGSNRGEGLAVYNKTKKETFMNMFAAQGGLGFGGKTFSQVFVFASERPLDDFINSGWTFGGQTTGAAKYEETGAALQEAVAVAPGVWLYQMTGSGFAAEMVATGTKYYKNDDLNER